MSTSKVVTRADLKAVLDEVLPAEAGLTTQFIEASATTINAGAISNFAFDVTKSGYTALGVVAFDGYDGGVSVVSIVQNNATTITMWLKNITNSAISVKPRITVLYAPCGTRTLVGDVDYIVEQGTDGIWTYRKWNSGKYHAWYENSVNFQAGSAWLGGYFHQTTSALTPPSFSQSVTSLIGQPNSDQLCIYCGHASDYSTYWFDAISTARNNIPVRLDMYGTWE